MGVIAKERSLVHTSLADYTFMVYGLPKVGKSTFCASIPDAYFLAFEAGLKALSVYKSPTDKDCFGSYEEFVDVAKSLAQTSHGYKTIVFDTVTAAYELAVTHVCKKNNVSSLADLEYGRGWAMARDALRRPILGLQRAGLRLVFICHEEIKSTFVFNNEVTVYQPEWNGKQCKQIVYPMVDMIGYMYLKNARRGNEMVNARHLTFTQTPHLVAGDRTGKLEGVEHVIEPKESGWAIIENYFNRQETEQ